MRERAYSLSHPMAYIAPNTTIYLLSDVPLNNSYGDTIYFASASAQQSYFQSKVAVTLSSQSYQRKDRNVLRVTIPYGQTYKVNYLMWRNASFENKWFYAFVLNVDYVNNETWDVTYEVDVMQTWFFDFTLEQCFIEREHSATDAIGDNITPENVDVGEYYCTNYEPLFSSQTIMAVVILEIQQGAISSGTLLNGIYSGCLAKAFQSTDVAGIQEEISHFSEAPENIVSIYMCPMWLVGEGLIPEGGMTVSQSAIGNFFDVTKPAISPGTSLGGYTPKNNKLYTYPYNFYQIDNGSGSTMKVRYEFFAQNQPKFIVGGTFVTPVELTVQPTNYKGTSDLEVGMQSCLHTESVSLTGFPVCSWNSDYFAAWAAQNSIPVIAQNVIGGAVTGAVAGGLPGLAAGAGAGILASVSSLLAGGYQAAIHADNYKGNLNSGSSNVAIQLNQFSGGRFHVSADYARMIDDYFTMFGYATHRVKVPNTHVRPHWTYTKTIGCMITGSVPGGDAAQICRIHDNGITYWINGNEVGDYSLDNSPST